MTFHEVDIVARTIYGEARGEYGRKDGGLAALVAVGNVIINRMKDKRRYGETLIRICQKPYQFSCWLKGDPNRSLIESVNQNDEVFKRCVEVSENLIYGRWPDLTGGSDHYHADYVMPPWANKKHLRIKIGRHLFYRLGGF